MEGSPWMPRVTTFLLIGSCSGLPYLNWGCEQDKKFEMVVGGDAQDSQPVPNYLRNTFKVDAFDEIFVQIPTSIEKRRIVHRAKAVFVNAALFVYLTGRSLFKASPPRLGD